VTAPLRLDPGSDGIARLVLDRPDRHNALSGDLIAALHDAADRIGADPSIRAVILSGAGPGFCAGADLAWMQAQVAADRAGRIAAATRLARMLQALNTLPKPLIGQVHGRAMGGGVGLMAVCDAVVIAADASVALTETRLGLIPATIGPYVLARIGEGAARRVFFSGRPVDGAGAVALGLAARAVPPGDLAAAALDEAAPYLQTAPGAVAAAKALARRLGPVIDDRVIADSITALADTWETPEAAAGIAAFLARRRPPWQDSAPETRPVRRTAPGKKPH
jgi:methylglutaconyl-CoA hydratase